jgi:hypothetical protein
MWTCPRDETTNSDTDIFCKICGKAKPILSEPRTDTPTLGGNSKQTNYSSHNYTNDKPGTYDSATKSGFISTKELRDKIVELQNEASRLKAGVIICVAIMFLMFAFPYAINDASYTIFNNIAGARGDNIYTVCSIVLLIFAILPAIFILLDLRIRQRNLPITISIVSGITTTIYCCVIWIGCGSNSNFIPFFIIVCSMFCILFSVKYVRKLQELDNLMYRPRMTGTF